MEESLRFQGERGEVCAGTAWSLMMMTFGCEVLIEEMMRVPNWIECQHTWGKLVCVHIIPGLRVPK